MQGRWRIGVPAGVLVAVVALFVVVPPSDLGPLGSALVFGAALAAVAAAVVRGSAPLRVGTAVVACVVGLGAGSVVYFFDRYPHQAELDRAIGDVGVPPGFTEDRALRNGADDYPFGELFAARTYRGAGMAEALTAEMVGRLRRSCYADAAVRPPSAGASPGVVLVVGECQHLDIEMTVGIESQASGVLLRFYASPRDLVPTSAPRLHILPTRGLLVSTRQ